VTLMPEDTLVTFTYGYPPEFRRCEIANRETITASVKITPNKFGTGMWEFITTVEVTIVVWNDPDNRIPPQLGKMEREVIRLIAQYQRDDIPGIDDLLILYMDRIYEFQGYMINKWISEIYIQAQYEKVNVEPAPE
jgi:hypothetical protein